MVYKEYDNAELFESNIPCPSFIQNSHHTQVSENIILVQVQHQILSVNNVIQLQTSQNIVLEIESAFSVNNCSQTISSNKINFISDDVPYRNSSYIEVGSNRIRDDLDGTFHIQGTGTYNKTAAAVCTENYAYYFIAPHYLSDGDIYIYEYNLQTDEVNSIVAYSNPDDTCYGGGISYLEDRKVLFYYSCDTQYDLLRIVDFSDNTVTTYVDTEDWVYDFEVVKRDDNHLWIFVIRETTIEIQDYTASSSWTSIALSSSSSHSITVSQDRYVVIPYTPTIYFQAQIIDLNDFSSTDTNTVLRATGDHSTYATIRGFEHDVETGLVVITAWDSKPDNIYFPDHYASVRQYLYIDPPTATMSSINSETSHPHTATGALYAWSLPTKEHVYTFKYPSRKIVRITDSAEVGTWPLAMYVNFSQNGFAYAMDNDKTYATVDRSTHTIKIFDFNENELASYSIPDATWPINTSWMEYMGSVIFYFEDQQQPSSYNHWRRVYLIN